MDLLKDVLLQYYIAINRGVEILAAITGIIVYKKYEHTNAKYFIYFLIYLSIGDYINNYVDYIKNDGIFNFLEGTVFIRNHWWSTLFWNIGAIFFFSFYFSKTLKTKLFRNIICNSGYGFLIFSFIYILLNWEDYFLRFFPVISIIGAIIIFLCSVFYFTEILLSDKILTFFKSLNFYISVAIFIWWLIITPLVFYDIYINKTSEQDVEYMNMRMYIYLFSNVFMYLTFTFALIWCKPEND